jgi:hypothetical protein
MRGLHALVGLLIVTQVNGKVSQHLITSVKSIEKHVGPRGGVYHYSKNGNKVYEKKN